ncbi:hypothetical protein TNCV_324151 [Trichonephila clavipes]|nr:hypothetical protein TNCV_324151 [Trichonephila clavipes]
MQVRTSTYADTNPCHQTTESIMRSLPLEYWVISSATFSPYQNTSIVSHYTESAFVRKKHSNPITLQPISTFRMFFRSHGVLVSMKYKRLAYMHTDYAHAAHFGLCLASDLSNCCQKKDFEPASYLLLCLDRLFTGYIGLKKAFDLSTFCSENEYFRHYAKTIVVA